MKIGRWLRRGLTAYLGVSLGWALARMLRERFLPERGPANRAPRGVTWEQVTTYPAYTVRHAVEDGIEWITYTPRQPRGLPPLLFVHGMWHAAWCWASWQQALAEWGWESHAISLPGHGFSPPQRPIHRCTLGYYLAFVREAIAHLPRRPVVVGHSMGGALTQWLLRYGGDDLPAAVLVAPWPAFSVLGEALPHYFPRDPVAPLGILFQWDATPMVRSPQVVGRVLLAGETTLSPEALHARLGPESALVLLQHNPPLWRPPQGVRTPTLWLAAANDAFFPVHSMHRAAQRYGGDFLLVPEAGHDVMFSVTGQKAVAQVHRWLLETLTGERSTTDG